MTSNKTKIYHVISLSELKELVAIAERGADESYGPGHEHRGNHCIILRGRLASGKNSRSKHDGARQIERLQTKCQAPDLFNFNA